MKLTQAQQNDIDICTYFYPCTPTDQEKEDYLAMSEHGIGDKRGKLSDNPLIIGKTRRGLTMGLWESGVLEGSTPYHTLLGGEDRPIPRIIVDFMKKEMFRGIDADLIERTYQDIIASLCKN